MKINVVLDDSAYMPEKAHEADAGFDLRTPSKVIIPAKQSRIISTGVHVEIPNGYVGFLKSKSGLNVKSGILSEDGHENISLAAAGDGAPEVAYPDECWHCGCCRLACPGACVSFKFPLHTFL